MNAPDWRQIVRDDLARRHQARLDRHRRVVRPIDATHVEIDGATYVNFASNNYLGLTHHPAVTGAARAAIARDGFGSGAAPLITGHGPAHAEAEAALARWKSTEAAVLLGSGFQANVAAVQTLATVLGRTGRGGAREPGGVRFLLDKLCHASLVDALRHSGQPYRVYPHNGRDKLRRLLADAAAGQVQVVVTESIFSMDGDAADLHGIAALKAEHGFVLLLDEAHASGVYGPAGAGYAAECGLADQVDVTVVTLSKALGGAGGAVCTSQLVCDALVNHARPYVYSTGPPAAVADAAVAALAVLRDEPQRQARVRDLARGVRAELRASGFDLPPGDSPIIPVILGDAAAALAAADALRRDGLLALAIRPPTVPKGSSRLRVTVSCEHADDEVDRLITALRRVRSELGDAT